MDINTLRDYIRALRRIFVVDDLQAWCPNLRSKATVRKSDTRHLCDPAVAAHFLGASADAMDADVFHYHDSDGLEADAIIHLRGSGGWGAIEVKLGQGMVDDAARNLLKIKAKVISEPAFLAVITGTEYAYTREDGIHVIPIGCLRE